MSLVRRIKSWFAKPPVIERTRIIYGPHTTRDDGRLEFSVRSAWEAADGGRLHHMYGGEEAATPSETDLACMRERASNLERSDGLCFAAIETKVANTITHKIRPQSMAYGDDATTLPPALQGARITEERAEVFRQQIEAGWSSYARQMCAGGGMEFEDFAWLAHRQMLSRGECFVHRVQVEGRKYSTAYEIIDGARISTPRGVHNDPAVSHGIRFDAYGNPVEYYVLKQSRTIAPTQSDYLTIPAANMRHLFKRLRADQVRGLPDLFAVLQSAKDRKDLADATIIKAQNSAAITAVMMTKNPGELETDMSTGQIRTVEKTWETAPIHKGQIQLLPHGDSITEFKSDYPSNTYDPFMGGTKADIARGVGISYLSLTRDASNANYSTMKGIWLQDRLTYHADRSYVRRTLLNWIWEGYCDEAVMRGYAEAPAYAQRRDVYTRVGWQFAPWGMIEPAREVDASIQAVKNQMASRANYVQGEGEDAEEVIDSNLRLELYEKEQRKSMGLEMPVLDAKGNPAKPKPKVEEEVDEESETDTE